MCVCVCALDIAGDRGGGGGGGHQVSVCEGDKTQARVAGPCSQNTRPSYLQTDTAWLHDPQNFNHGEAKRRWRDLIAIGRYLKSIKVKEKQWHSEATASRAGWCATYQLAMEDETVKQHQTRKCMTPDDQQQ